MNPAITSTIGLKKPVKKPITALSLASFNGFLTRILKRSYQSVKVKEVEEAKEATHVRMRDG